MFKSEPIKVNRNDIFNYVVGKTQFDPIEHCIDPTRYEVQQDFIYDFDQRLRIEQAKDFIFFNKEVYKLREIIQNPDTKISRAEIIKICEELMEIAPKTVKLTGGSANFDVNISEEALSKIQKLFPLPKRKFGDAKENSHEEE